jgi:hypothetical protein
MTPNRCKIWIAALAIVSIVLLGATAYLAVRSAAHRADLRYAFEIVESFGDKAAAASKSSTAEACDILWQLHYPSFDWRATHPFHGAVDNFVEGQRRRAVAEVIRYLRAKTGDDLGTDPEGWLLKYGSQSVKEDLKIMKEESKTNAPNHAASGSGAMLPLFRFLHLRRAVPEQTR